MSGDSTTDGERYLFAGSIGSSILKDPPPFTRFPRTVRFPLASSDMFCCSPLFFAPGLLLYQTNAPAKFPSSENANRPSGLYVPVVPGAYGLKSIAVVDNSPPLVFPSVSTG